jgi:DNA-binding transcriptional MerR regulator
MGATIKKTGIRFFEKRVPPMRKNGAPGQPTYTTGELARLTSNTLRTVRYYEELGLLSPAPRRQGAHRLFTELDAHRLRTITDMRAVGLTLEQVAEVLYVRLRRPQAAKEVERATRLIDEQLVIIGQRLNTLMRVEKDLRLARDILEKCRTCHELLTGTSCADCAAREPNVSLLSVLMAPPEPPAAPSPAGDGPASHPPPLPSE